MKRLDYAPILVSVYDRFEHLSKCIGSLQECVEAPFSDLFISSDAAYREGDKGKVDIVRNYINSITGFRNVYKIFHSPNKGDALAARICYNSIFERFDSVIRLEDDVIVSPDFLTFMNQALIKYHDNKQVFSVSGFSHSVFYEIPEEKVDKVYFTQRFNPWGCGMWRDRWYSRDRVGDEDIKKWIRIKSVRKRMNEVGIDRLPQIDRAIRNNLLIPNDYKNGIYMIMNDMYSVTPYISKSFNIGNDGSGMRSGANKRFQKTDLSFLDKGHPFDFPDNLEGNIDNSFHHRFNYTNFNLLKKSLSWLGVYDMAYRFRGLR